MPVPLFWREYDGLATRAKATRGPEIGSQPCQSQYHPEDLASGARVLSAFGLRCILAPELGENPDSLEHTWIMIWVLSGHEPY